MSTLTPANCVSNFDHVVTQWMSPRYSDGGSACASSQVQVVGGSTWPSTVMLHVSGRDPRRRLGGEHRPVGADVVLPGRQARVAVAPAAEEASGGSGMRRPPSAGPPVEGSLTDCVTPRPNGVAR